MIKKHQILGLALFAVFAFSAVLASSAFAAEETLTAAWLFNAAAVTAALPTKTVGSLLLEDTETIAGKVAILCEGILDGSVNSGGKDEITEVLTTAGVLVEELKGSGLKCVDETTCSSSAAIEVWPEHLPWKTQAVLLDPSEKFGDILTSEAGYTVLCTVLGIAVEDICTAKPGTLTSLENGATDVILTAGAVAEPHASCSAGKATSDVIETDEALLEDTSAGTLAISE